MTRADLSGGSDFLSRRSKVAQAKTLLPDLKDILVVEDRGFDAKRMTATLHQLFGREATIRVAASLDKAIDAVLQSPPNLIFLDDYLEPNDSALETIPLVRRAGYDGPIIVLSGELDRGREIALRRAGADEAIHKDKLDYVKLGEAVLRAFGQDV